KERTEVRDFGDVVEAMLVGIRPANGSTGTGWSSVLASTARAGAARISPRTRRLLGLARDQQKDGWATEMGAVVNELVVELSRWEERRVGRRQRLVRHAALAAAVLLLMAAGVLRALWLSTSPPLSRGRGTSPPPR